MTMVDEDRAAVDSSAWDGNKAMGQCNSAADYRKICAGEHSVGSPDERQHWALPHHYLSQAPTPNAAGVRNALSRLPQTQNLSNAGAARSHLEAHMRTIQGSASSRPPRDGLVRALVRGAELRHDGEAPPTMFGHFAVFNRWTEINSLFEGRFLEQIAPGSFQKTIQENRDRIRVLFNHGRDPNIGDKPLGPISELREDSIGTYYEVPLLDTSYNRDLLPGLRSDPPVYGASFRFRVIKEDYDNAPERSDYNPDGLPERTVREVELYEFGAVTFPAYDDATASVRSLTDEFVTSRMLEDPAKLRQIIEGQPEPRPIDVRTSNAATEMGTSGNTATVYISAPVTEPRTIPTGTTEETSDGGHGAEGSPHSEPAPTDRGPKEDPEVQTEERYRSKEEKEARVAEIKQILASIHQEFSGELPAARQAEWDQLNAERVELENAITAWTAREALVREMGKQEKTSGPAYPGIPGGGLTTVDRGIDPFDVAGVYERAGRRGGGPDSLAREFRDTAMRVVETERFDSLAHGVTREQAQAHIQRLLDTIDGRDDERSKSESELAKLIMTTGSPVYRRALGKWIRAHGQVGALSPEEQRALSLGTGSAGGFAVVYSLDPTVVPTSNFSVNPYRAIARVEQIAGTNEWKAVTSGAITAAYAAEGTEATDNAPTLAQPDIIVERAQAFVPFSLELGQDWGALQSEMASLLSDAKDDLEATKFTTGAGHGSNEPKGLITAATTTTTAGGTAAFAIADLYKVFEALPPRFRPRAQWVGNLFTYDKVRQFDTAGGSGVWVDGSATPDLRGLGVGVGGAAAGTVAFSGIPRLLGRNAWESTAMDSALTTGSKILAVGDFRYFVIVDRVGMAISFLPFLVGTNHRPTGQQGLYAFWRNSSDALSAAAFRVLVTGALVSRPRVGRAAWRRPRKGAGSTSRRTPASSRSAKRATRTRRAGPS
jgi:HK97 family phage major capsid protein/HK97 family phage prohead protease